ncbi:MAG: acyltransferase [Pseudomonadota bacterium]
MSNIKNFYIRRIFRLMPALLFYITTFTIILKLLGAEITLNHLLSGIFYFANYYHLFIGYPLHSPIPILWSLSVEEHFYILFPIFIYFLRAKPKPAIYIMISLLFCVLAWRFYLYNECIDGSVICGIKGRIRTQASDAIFDTIIYGALAAYCYKNFAIFHSKKAFLIACLGVLVSLVFRNPEFRETLRYSLQAFCISIIIINLSMGCKFELITNILKSKIMNFIGRISYSLYLFHFGVLVTIEAISGKDRLSNITEIMIYFLLSFLLATTSYYAIEKPFLKLRSLHN